MMKLLTVLTATLMVASPVGASAQNTLENDPGYLAIDTALDLKTIKPEVNINLPKFLLKDALADIEGVKEANLNIAELIQDVKLIRVVVMEADKSNSDAVEKGITALKSTLDSKWTPIAVVADGSDNVGVYAISDPSGESTAGLAVLIHEKGGDAIIGNIVGKVSLGKIVKVASQMDKLPKDFLKKLTEAAAGSGEKPKEKASAQKAEN